MFSVASLICAFFSLSHGQGIPLPQQSSQNDPLSPSYNFQYVVKDVESLNFYGHQEQRSGPQAQGRYFVRLPDARTMVVTYIADETGYHPRISFEDDIDNSFEDDIREGRVLSFFDDDSREINDNDNDYFDDDDDDDNQFNDIDDEDDQNINFLITSPQPSPPKQQPINNQSPISQQRNFPQPGLLSFSPRQPINTRESTSSRPSSRQPASRQPNPIRSSPRQPSHTRPFSFQPNKFIQPVSKPPTPIRSAVIQPSFRKPRPHQTSSNQGFARGPQVRPSSRRVVTPVIREGGRGVDRAGGIEGRVTGQQFTILTNDLTEEVDDDDYAILVNRNNFDDFDITEEDTREDYDLEEFDEDDLADFRQRLLAQSRQAPVFRKRFQQTKRSSNTQLLKNKKTRQNAQSPFFSRFAPITRINRETDNAVDNSPKYKNIEINALSVDDKNESSTKNKSPKSRHLNSYVKPPTREKYRLQEFGRRLI